MSVISAINQFRQAHGLVGVVVCSRTQDYNVLPVRLKVQGAVRLQPLALPQVAAYMAAGGAPLASLAPMLKDDPAMQELAQRPLLLNIMRLAYHNSDVAYLPALDSIAQRRTQFFTRGTILL